MNELALTVVHTICPKNSPALQGQLGTRVHPSNAVAVLSRPSNSRSRVVARSLCAREQQHRHVHVSLLPCGRGSLPPPGGDPRLAPRRVGARRLVPGARASRSFKTHAPMTRQPSHSKRPFHAVSSRSRPWPPWPTTRPAPASARSSTPDSPPEPSAPSRSRPSSPSTGAAPSRHTARSDRVRLSAERTQRGRGLFTSVPPIVRAPRDEC